MKNRLYTGILTILTLLLIAGVGFTQQTSQGQGSQMGSMHQGMMSQQQSTPMPQQQSGWFCPWCGRMCGMRGGMMMHRGMMHHRGMMMHGGGVHGMGQAGKPLSKQQAEMLVEHYLQMKGNPNLKLGKITDEKDYFVAEITTKDGSLVEKYQIDKNTGWFKSIY